MLKNQKGGLMKTKDEIRDWLLDNAVNDVGDLELTGLDFSKFQGDVCINAMKVANNLYQGYHVVGGNLFQGRSRTVKNLYQDFQTVGGVLLQTNSHVEGDLLDQRDQRVKGTLLQNEKSWFR